MSAAHDRKFFDTFMLVLGILAAVTIGLMILAAAPETSMTATVSGGGLRTVVVTPSTSLTLLLFADTIR